MRKNLFHDFENDDNVADDLVAEPSCDEYVNFALNEYSFERIRPVSCQSLLREYVCTHQGRSTF